MSFDDFVEQQIIGNGITLQQINTKHISVIAQLPLHHRDPFDRMLIAQAMVENIPIISADIIFDAYPIRRLWSRITQNFDISFFKHRGYRQRL
ncbi:MAG: type II toxin-antitoxin system VapC family toxin, partial [Cuspidothrix sp.]